VFPAEAAQQAGFDRAALVGVAALHHDAPAGSLDHALECDRIPLSDATVETSPAGRPHRHRQALLPA
jgi:hypothetical protein